jgi:type IV pilus assembly protein PilP
MSRWYFLLATVAALLSGCGVSSEDELRTWMQDQRNEMRPRVPALTEPKPYRPESYASAGSIDPFNKEKLLSVFRRDQLQSKSTSNALVAPELARRKQALEAYPLDSMSMVGSLLQDGQPAALVSVDKQLYQVRIGNYLGTNFGKVVKIAETEVVLREIVQDAVGEWVERMATLQLQEKAK